MTDYSFYTESYLTGREAVIDAASFPHVERTASNIVRGLTYGNIDETNAIPEPVQMCVCEVAEALHRYDKLSERGVTSEKVGDYSVTYEVQTKTQLTKDIVSIVRNWLQNTGLLFSGVI